jgi:hypothetical protein
MSHLRNINTRNDLGRCGPNSCPKSGIKIHETINNSIYSKSNYNNKNYNSNYISEIQNNKSNKNSIQNIPQQSHLKKPVSFHNTSLSQLDLDLNNYSLNDLYTLFNITNGDLNEISLKSAKQVVLKMHPDKSNLEPKFFLFFSSAYKRLKEVYDFQNKSYTNKKYVDEDFFDDSNKELLNHMLNKPEFKDGGNFNKWFNTAFEKHRLEDPTSNGYQDWLKSDEGFMNINETVTKSNMNEIFERQKRQLQDIVVYKGVTDSLSSSSIGGFSFDNTSNFSTEVYTDLRQAYTETLIPVTNEDFEKLPKYRNVNEYKTHRDQIDVTPINETESQRILYNRNQEANKQSAALAYKYALEAEKAKEKQTSFWGDIKRLTGF